MIGLIAWSDQNYIPLCIIANIFSIQDANGKKYECYVALQECNFGIGEFLQ